MHNTFGKNLSVTIFGESHGPEIGVVLDGLKPGINIDEEYINKRLTQRRPVGKISTARQEKDPYRLSSGVFEGKTTGTPLMIVIPNENTKSGDYTRTAQLARPGHADYTAQVKYDGYQDFRGGGHFSGRITTGVVAGAAIVQKYLEEKGIYIGTHIKRCALVDDAPFTDYLTDIKNLNDKMFATIDDSKGEEMKQAIEAAAMDGDSVGGILETVILGLPAGIGDPWFDSFESILSHGLFSVPGIKGVEFGAGFGISDMRGSVANDSFYMDNDTVRTKTNNNGGINGGITNGMPVIFRCAVKPTPSIFKAQDTIDYINKKDAVLDLKGRHDPAIIHRARVVVDSMAALAVYDMLSEMHY